MYRNIATILLLVSSIAVRKNGAAMNLTNCPNNYRHRTPYGAIESWEVDIIGNLKAISMMAAALISVVRRSYFDAAYGTAALLLALVTSFNGGAHAVTLPSALGSFAPEWTVGISRTINNLNIHPNDSCDSCVSLGYLGPPPDTILSIPPPPLPSFLQDVAKKNYSRKSGCNLCGVLYRGEQISSGLSLSIPSVNGENAEHWVMMVGASVGAAAILSGFLAFIFVKCKKWKIFPVTVDSCPILPESFLSHKSSSNGKDSSDSSPVSIKSKEIMGSGARKYWRRGSSQERPLQSGSPQCSEINSCCEEPYVNQETTSCADSPLYAELEPSPTGESSPAISVSGKCNPYMVHTYTDILAPINMIKRPLETEHHFRDGAYDNAAFFAAENRFPVRLSRLDQNICNADGLVVAFPCNFPSPLFQTVRGKPGSTGYVPKKPRPTAVSQMNQKEGSHVLVTAQGFQGSLQSSPRYKTPKVPICSANVILSPNLKDLQKRPLPPVPVEHV